ncbi:hypothetical protein NEUTE1DRAFT_88395 [Neurospora tetrasperma FGSC 2508]|uniref:Uncharacterized protein n=1 Tax=Neurospora tetrasperma (strain FGSC 2508 / ATCC MYA-4615 / P0657) TaxID=510951 RepID=F8MVN4_NEUT8|nr:uncharacterized protein NEUTE1DRAFT_88395 [Neurospora tetrasperma FGSC 2508]EGO54785.1 hypothetical protein NEUTE1DRAFT_88395 [Neurospora tetrasperma FGSC 2508]EGZ67731.1 hypothetical protein NEUTE2DRAFT_116934 [Neurospora tetrasperma FGSC 2509]
MADPLSIAGLVTGVVSLGIQLHNDLKIFLDIVKNRDEDIAKLTRQAATMAQALDAIDRSLQNSKQANPGVVDSATIIPLLDTSRQELLLLQQEVASLTKTSKGQKLKGSGVVDFARATTQKLKYPRQRAKIEKLEEDLDQANTTLQLSLDAFGLYESLVHLLIIAILLTFRSELSSIKSNTEAMVHGLTHVQKTLPDVEACVSKLSEKLMATNQTATQGIQNIEAILNLAISSHQSNLEQIGQAQSNEFSQIKQLIQDLLLRMDANASTGSKDIEVNRNLACLVSKPSALKVLCDEYSSQQPQSECPSDANAWSACTCQRRRIATRRSVDWGPFRLFAESKAELAHHESCQWAQFNTSKRSKVISLAYRGFTRLLRHAVVINFRLNHGAGGFSFGPGIVHYPVMDERVYAPFRLVYYVKEAMQVLTRSCDWLSRVNPTLNSQMEIRFSALRHKVLEAFSMHISRACSNGSIVPRAVNIQGETLLHYVSSLIKSYAVWTGFTGKRNPWTPSMVAPVHEVFARLIMCNVPTTVYDNGNRLAHLTVANYVPDTETDTLASMTSILKLFILRDMDIDPSEARDRVDTFQPRLNFLKPLPEAWIFGKAFGCNQLGIAVLQQNISYVRSLISRNPSLAFERDLNRRTPLHYAVLWKDGLSILLEQVPFEDVEGDLAWDIFQYALSTYKMNHRELCSEECHCSKCIELFLDHSWYFAHSSSWGPYHGTLRLVVGELPLAAQKKLLLYLKRSRQEILNIMDLPTGTIRRIIDHLQKIAATFLSNTKRAKIQAAIDSFDIYRETKDADMADAAWQLGFREVNYHAVTDLPPLAYIPYDTPLRLYSPESSRRRGDYVLWLLNHDADPFQPLQDTEGHILPILAAHQAIHCITYQNWVCSYDLMGLKCRLKRPSKAVYEVACRLCSEPITDSCLCACSANGCTPFLILSRNFLADFPSFNSTLHGLSHPNSFAWYAYEFKRIWTMLYEKDGFVCQYEGQFHEALRLFTFISLGIRHTCCKKDGHHDDGDTEEIREEDSELVNMLETLMEEWGNVRFESAKNFGRFLQDNWVIRLNEVFKDLRQIDQSEEHRARLQSLGVQLHAPKPPIVKVDITELPVRIKVRRERLVWCKESFGLDLLDTVVEGGDTSYYDRVLKDAYQDDILDLVSWDEEGELGKRDCFL